jgi:hypothetical protein
LRPVAAAKLDHGYYLVPMDEIIQHIGFKLCKAIVGASPGIPTGAVSILPILGGCTEDWLLSDESRNLLQDWP